MVGMAAAADLEPTQIRHRLDSQRCDEGFSEGLEDLHRSTGGGIRLYGKVPRGSSQPRDRDDAASRENRA